MQPITYLAPALLLSSVTLANATPVELTDKLTASDGAAGDFFGYSVALSGSTAIVGAYGDGGGSGSAYLFDTTTTGAQTQKLLAGDGAASDFFGYSVAISGSTAIVGAPRAVNNSSTTGSAYIFDFSDSQNVTQTKLIASGGEAGDFFGQSVAISGSTAIVGAPLDANNDSSGSSTVSGSAYLFNASTGVQTHKLTDLTGAGGDRFGQSVAISGNLALVGAYGDDAPTGNSGSAYLFNASTGEQIAKLTASDGAAGDEFGRSVAISGTTAIVGAWLDNDNSLFDSGAAYLFDLSDLDPSVVSLTETAKLLASDGAGGDYFGYSVAISGSTAIVGAYGDDDNGTTSGSAYFYDITDIENPVEKTKLIADDGAVGDRFGWSVGISGSTAIVGAYLNDDPNDSGSAYLYDASAPAPVPLPASLWLLGAAVGGAAGLRRVAQRRRT